MEQNLPEEFIKAIVLAANELDSSCCVSKASWAGKTFTARNVIGNLIANKKVRIYSNNHKAIINLMEGVADHLLENNITGNLIKIGGEDDDPIFDKTNVVFRKDAKACGEELNDKPLCIGGTAVIL